MPCWEQSIAPDLRAGKYVLISAHGNSLRALVKMLDEVSDEDITGFNIPTGIPLVYQLDDDTSPITGLPMYTGPHTSRTARIEPITPPGQVYASASFAAVAAATGVTDGSILPGIKREVGYLTAETILMRSKTGSVRRMTYRHPIGK